MRKLPILLLLVVSIYTSYSQNISKTIVPNKSVTQKKWVDSIYNKMSFYLKKQIAEKVKNTNFVV